MKKIYAVRKGKKTGIFSSWAECQKQVNGFSGAEFKSFLSIKEANEFLGITKNYVVNEKENKTYSIKDTKINKNNKDEILIYVDGSYENSIKAYGSGVVILKNDKIIKEFSIKGNDKNLISMRNVAGEIEASKIAMNYCVENNIKSIKLYFDYEGIEKWCTGVWKTNKIGTENYKKFYDSIKDKLEVKFIKVKAHSGDKYNDLADLLAKKSLTNL